MGDKALIWFRVRKKRFIRNLVERAAEVVGQFVENADDLVIPETLKEEVKQKIIDANWVKEYWLAMNIDRTFKEEIEELTRKAEDENITEGSIKKSELVDENGSDSSVGIIFWVAT